MKKLHNLQDIKNASKIVEGKSAYYLDKPKGQMANVIIATNEKLVTGVSTVLTPAPYNRHTKDLDGVECTIKVGDTTHKFTKEDRFLDKYISVSMNARASQTYANKECYIDLSKNIIALPSTDKEGKTVYINAFTGRQVKTEKLNKYVLVLATASGMRAKKNLFNAVFVKLEEGETVSKVLDKRCYNIIKHANKKMSKGQAAKFMSRPGLGWTASKSFGKIECVAQISGVFDFDFKRNTFDGVGFATDEEIAEKFQISKEEAMKLSFQSRPGQVIKIQLKVLPKALFLELFDKYVAEGRATVHGQGKPSFMFDSNSIKAGIDLDNIELDVLAIGKTTDTGLSKQIIEKAVLEAATLDRIEGGSKHLDKLVDYILDLGKTTIAEALADVKYSDKEVTPDMNHIYDVINNAGKRSIPNAKKTALLNTLRKIAKDIDKLSFSDGNMFYSVIYTDTAQLFGYELLKAGEVYYPKMKNVARRGVGIKYPSMGAKEYYSFTTVTYEEMATRIDNLVDASDKLKKALKKEYRLMSKSLVVFPASRLVFNSCAGMDIDMDAIALVFSEEIVDLLHGKEEYVELISGNKKGEKALEKAAKDKYSVVNVFRKRSDNGDEVATDILESNEYNPASDTFGGDMFKMATTSDTKSIGEITFHNNKSIAVAIEVLKGNLSPFALLFEENVGKSTGSAEYKGLPVDKDGAKTLSEENIDLMLKEMRSCGLTQENMIRMILDFNRCFRLYQETTIDAAKTGTKVDIAVLCRTVMAKSLVKVKFFERRDANGSVSFGIEREARENNEVIIYVDGIAKTVNEILIEDDMSKIQDELIAFTMEQVKVLEETVGLYKFQGVGEEADMTSALSVVLGLYNEKFAGALSVMLEFKYIYNALAAEYGEALGQIDQDEKLAEEKMEVLRNQFQAKLDNVSNSVERLLSKFKGKTDMATLDLRGRLMVAVGALNRKGLITEGSTNKFAFSVASHYALGYALAGNQYTSKCKVLHCADGVEGEVKVRYGFADDCSLIVKENFKDRENGEATLNVTRLADGTVEVTETNMVEIPEIDDTKSTVILNANIDYLLDAKGEVVLDASGNPRVEATCESGKVLKAIAFDVVAKRISKEEMEFSFMLNGKKHTLDLPKDKLMYTDARVGSTYKVTNGYVIRNSKKVVLELTK